jgi:hypothetical protein
MPGSTELHHLVVLVILHVQLVAALVLVIARAV